MPKPVPRLLWDGCVSISIIARNMAWFQNHYGRFVRVDGQWKAIVEGSQFGDARPESTREPDPRPDGGKP